MVNRRQQLERDQGRESRPTIGRDTAIDGGVYEGSYGGEAIVVDSEKYPAIGKALDTVLERITVNGNPDKNLALRAIFDHVSKEMRYDSGAVEQIFQQSGGEDGVKVGLDAYIDNHVGVCRHQALFAGALLEQLVKKEILKGNVSVDRNRVRNDANDKYDGHAWVRYTTSGGVIYVLDVAQKKAGTLDDFMAARRNGETMWDYARPEDHERLRAQLAMNAARVEDAWITGSARQSETDVPSWYAKPLG